MGSFFRSGDSGNHHCEMSGPTVVSYLQTKKYADVIIPRGVDNMGKGRLIEFCT